MFYKTNHPVTTSSPTTSSPTTSSPMTTSPINSQANTMFKTISFLSNITGLNIFSTTPTTPTTPTTLNTATTINYSEIYWDSIKIVTPPDIFSEITCTYSDRINNNELVDIINYIISRLIYREINIPENTITTKYIINIYENVNLCERIGALFFIRSLAMIDRFKIKVEETYIYFLNVSNLNDEYSKIITWNKNTKNFQLDAMKEDLMTFRQELQNVISSSGTSPTITIMPETNPIPREVVNYLTPINLDAMSSIEMARILLLYQMIYPFFDMKKNCVLCSESSGI